VQRVAVELFGSLLPARMVWCSVTVCQMSTSTVSDHDIAAARAADVRQADYYRGELSRQRELLIDRMAAHEAALAKYQLRGEMNQVHRIRREIRHREQEQYALQRLLDAIEERFPAAAGPGPAHL
jgi:hypothetical protein